jgi:phosphatidylserine decarboxylase
MNPYEYTDPPSHLTLPVARAGYPLIFSVAFITAVLALLGLTWPALICLCLTVALGGFFRDPDRVTPTEEGTIVAPADGKVVEADIVTDSPYISGECLKIGIFMSVFNVHVNRVPFEGDVTNISYSPGQFSFADRSKASMFNERNAVFVETADKQQYCMVQIAGWVARRIICYIRKGDPLLKGQRFGLICFGSRVDLYLPARTKLNVTINEKVKAGRSIIAFLEAGEA